MYNLKYGDGKNYQIWSPSQDPQQQKQQQQQPQRTPSQPPLTTIGRHIQSPEDITQPSRLWVDVQSDEEAMHQLSLFKQSSKSHLTPPLDLSEGRRQVESPLDLSVKTRKRCADTTDYAETIPRHSVEMEPSAAKRQCLTRDHAYPAGHPRYRAEQLDRKYPTESASRSKMMAMGGSFSAGLAKQVSALSPSAIVQQQYELQRQQMESKSRSLPVPQKHHSSPYGASTQGSHPVHHPMKKSQSMYEPDSAVVKKSPHSSMTESVALKDFFEPTHKVTVQTHIPQQTVAGPQQQLYPRVPSDQRVAGAPNRQIAAPVMSELDDPRRSHTFPSPHTYQQRASSGSTVGFMPPTSYEMEHLQHQYQQHLQKSQREHLAIFSQLNQQKAMMLATSEQQKLAYALERQKQAESRTSQRDIAQGGYVNRGQLSPYSARQPPSATSSFQDSLRKERADFASATCIRVGQPVPLGDIQQDHSHALEQVHAVRNRPELYVQQDVKELYKTSVASAELLHSNPQVFSTTAGIAASMSRFEHESRTSGAREIRDRPYYVNRTEQNSIGEIPIHPSVIQRPQGFIPPRIVRRNVMPSESPTQRRPHEATTEVHQLQRYRQEMYERDRERPQYSHKHNDMLSGKEVMKIQQRVAEQRAEGSSSSHTTTRNYPRQMNIRENEQVYPHVSQMTAMKGQIRRRSLTETMSRDARVPEQNLLSVPSEVRKQYEPVNTITSPKVTVNEAQRENRGEVTRLISSKSCPSERSITKGTSGLKTKQADLDPFSRYVRRELQRTDDDSSVNPFANRSILQEFDRSANSSPIHKPRDTHTIQSDIPSASSVSKVKLNEDSIENSNVSTRSDSTYSLPLQIAIPGHKVTTSVAVTAAAAGPSVRTSVIANSKPETDVAKHPKHMSRKQMILSAFRQEEDLKNNANTVNIDKDEKVPMESAKFAAMKSEREANQHGHPPSPKMPILSPQERSRVTPMVSPAIGEPPALESSSSASINNINNSNNNESSKKEMNSLEEHLHRLISDAVKGHISKDKDSVYESFQREFRELTSQPPGNKVFLTRQLSQTRNIPVANVAPIIHGKTLSESSSKDKTKDQSKAEDTDEEDAKMADIVTRSLWVDLALAKANTDAERQNSESKREDLVSKQSEESRSASAVNETLFDQNSNSSRMSPGLKKLMLYRHRDGAGQMKSKSGSNDNLDKSEKRPEAVTSDMKVDCDNDKSVASSRNVFGSFKDIVSRKSSTDQTSDAVAADSANRLKISEPSGQKSGDGSGRIGYQISESSGQKSGDGSGWTGYQNKEDTERHDMELNSDYDGDDEQTGEKQSAKRSKLSAAKQQADRLIKRARHRRNSKQDGDARSRHIAHRSRSHKGFVDFIPQVLPRRTRSKSTGPNQQRRHSKSGSPARSSGFESKVHSSPRRTRQRRASSLDRETKSDRSKAKSKTTCHSDNEVDSEKKNENAGDSDATWRNEDESTDEEYFQNYEDEFKQFIRKGDVGLHFKKSNNANKKRKGFHFKQKYIFQRKKKANRGRGRGFDPLHRYGGNLDAIYNFHEESPDPSGLQRPLGDVFSNSNVPVPADLKRVTVGKESGQTMLHRAARMGFEEVVLYCLATGTVDVNARDNAGYTALHECALRGRVQIAKHLLTYGADVNCCSTDGIRPIHDAVENDHLEILRLLLSYGADPTLSTYAGRSLAKIARTERMLKFIQRYNGDINGYTNDKEEKRWQFKRSSSILPEPKTGTGCPVFDGLPSDPEDESQDICTFSCKPLFTTRRITLEPNNRVEDFLLLDEVLDNFRNSRSELFSQGTGSNLRHLIKQLPIHTLIDAHKDSIYYENFANKDDSVSVDVIRKVDSTQLIAKLEKCISASPKRTKV